MLIRNNSTGDFTQYSLVQPSGDFTTFTKVGIATSSEAIAGTNATQIITPQNLASVVNAPIGATFTVGAEAVNVINVAIQLTDAAGTNMAVRASLFGYLSDDANGDSLITTAPDGGVAIGTDGLAIPLVANKAFQFTSESDGDIDINLTESGALTCYLILVLPTGKLAASGAITFAA